MNDETILLYIYCVRVVFVWPCSMNLLSTYYITILFITVVIWLILEVKSYLNRMLINFLNKIQRALARFDHLTN